MIELFNDVAISCSKAVTNRYSTSFSYAVKLLDKKFHDPIYAVYGFVRFADEIVDTFHGFDQALLLKEFRHDTEKAIERRISLNPVLNSFQKVVHQYNIPYSLIDSFLKSMEMDLSKKHHDISSYHLYILGSAEVVGLMCLKIFCENNNEKYLSLKKSAMALGAAFQKINFLRDFSFDAGSLGRQYFPHFKGGMTEESKRTIEREIRDDLMEARKGIMKLPLGCRLGVYSAYLLYRRLFAKLSDLPVEKITSNRVRIANKEKVVLLVAGYFRHRLNLI